MPSTKDSRRRHSKTLSQSRSLAPPSAISVMSSSTSGSNSTITPERAFRSSLRPSKNFDSTKLVPKEASLSEEVVKGNNETISDNENVDVFTYMDKETQDEDSGVEADDVTEDTPDEEASTTSTSPDAEPPLPQTPKYHDLKVEAIEAGEQHIWRKQKAREGSLHSDSGISVRSSSPERESPILRHKYPNVRSIANAGKGVQPIAYPNHHLAGSPDSIGPRTSAYPRDWSTFVGPTGHPEAYYTSSRPVITQTIQPPRSQSIGTQRRHSGQLIRTGMHSQSPPASPKNAISKKGGYEVLASAIDSRDDALLKPIYRKFETLNNRILLYLQDEISEIEEDLRELDNAIAREDEALGRRSASRRAESKLPTQLQWRRLDLLGRSYTKVEQYNRALSSYSSLAKSLEPASHADINVYRDWISEHAPIIEQEAAFLRNELDLIAVSTHNKNLQSSQKSVRSELESPVIIVAIIHVSAIIVFRVVPQILARVVISAMVGVASLCTLSPSVLTNPKSIKDWRKCILVYAAVMLVLAVIIR